MLSIKPHVPLNTGAATWPPGLPQVACAMFLSSPKTINAMVSQGSRGSASPRHVVAFLKGPGLQRRASGSYGVTSNTSLLQWNPGNQRFVRTDVTLRTALEPTGPSKSRCQRSAWPSPYHRRDPAIEVGKSPGLIDDIGPKGFRSRLSMVAAWRRQSQHWRSPVDVLGMGSVLDECHSVQVD